MPGERCAIGKDSMITNQTVMGDMNIRHQPVIVANAGQASPIIGTTVDCDKLANSVPVTDLQTGSFSMIFFVLRYFTYRTELEKSGYRDQFESGH
jgi:hypothetical protein